MTPPEMQERVAKAFDGSLTLNESWLSEEQVRCIRTLCADMDFCRAVFTELVDRGVIGGIKK